MNWDYVRGKKTKRKIKINKQKGNKQTKKLQKITKKFIRQFGSKHVISHLLSWCHFRVTGIIDNVLFILP
jgi:hypothetical protein